MKSIIEEYKQQLQGIVDGIEFPHSGGTISGYLEKSKLLKPALDKYQDEANNIAKKYLDNPELNLDKEKLKEEIHAVTVDYGNAIIRKFKG